MKKIVVEKDLGVNETFDKWNGKFLDETSYDTLVKVTDEDVGVMKPVNSLDGSDVPLAYVITNVYNDNDVIRNTLMSIEDVSVMRANCAGPIDAEEMKKKGLIEGEHYKLRTPNSYYVKTKSGKWGMIAYANEINSVMIGAKRGRFTGAINISNPIKWEELEELCVDVERAFYKAAPEIYRRQRKYAEEAIAPEHRHGMVTTLSANRYSAMQSTAMAVHSDGKDVEYTTMSCHRQGSYTGAYLSFPRWGVGIDLPDNSVCIADSKSLHCVEGLQVT